MMIDTRKKRHGSSVFARILTLAFTLSFCQLAQAAPPLWEASYDVGGAFELDGTFGPTGGQEPSGTLSGTENVTLGFNFPYGGNTYSNIVVDSDGAILLTNSSSEVTSVLPTIWQKQFVKPNFTNLGGGSPKPVIAPFGTSLDQYNTFGTTHFKLINGTFNGFTGNRAVITWVNSTLDNSATSDATFQLQLLDDGTIIFSYQPMPTIADWHTRAAQGILVGVTNGEGSPPQGSSDISSVDSGIGLTGYQIWCRNDDPNNPENCAQSGLGKNNAFDLANKSIVFNPDGDTGFLVSSTIKDGSGGGASGVCPVSNADTNPGPMVWDDSYDIAATELNGTAGGAVGGVGPSGRLSGTENIAFGFNFPFTGTFYTNLTVTSNGSILLTNSPSLVTSVTPTIWMGNDFQPGFTNFGMGSKQPVILPFNTAIDQYNTFGKTYFKYANDTFAGFTGERAVITWENSTLDNTDIKDIVFQAHFFDDGTIIFSYKVKTNVSLWDTRALQGIVVGISDGAGSFPLGSQNFSTYDFGIDKTGYEIWCRKDDPNDPENCAQSGLDGNDGFDLKNRSVVFNPDGSTGFLVSSKIKDGAGKGGSDVCAEPPPPSAPVAVDDAIAAIEDTKFTSVTDLDANDTDANGDKLVVIAGTFTTVRGGKIKIESDGSYTYDPATNFFGADSYDYTVKEKNGSLSDVGRLNINVIQVNDPPVANDDSAETAPNTVFNSTQDLDANDTDVDSVLTVINGTFPTAKAGSITIATDGSYSYTPPANFAGADNVDYTVTDGLLNKTARLNIAVTTEAIDITESVLKSVIKLQKNKSIRNHRKSKKSMKRARKHLEAALVFFKMSDEVSAKTEIANAIADLGKVKKKKGSVSDLISVLESMP